MIGDNSRSSSKKHRCRRSKDKERAKNLACQRSGYDSRGYERINLAKMPPPPPPHSKLRRSTATIFSSGFDGTSNKTKSSVTAFSLHPEECYSSQTSSHPIVCCKHGQKCGKGNKLERKLAKKANARAQQQENETDDFYVAANRAVSNDSDQPSFIRGNVQENEIEQVFNRNKAYVESPGQEYRPAFGYEKIVRHSGQVPPPPKSKSKRKPSESSVTGEIHVEPEVGKQKSTTSNTSDVLTIEKFPLSKPGLRRPIFEKMKMAGPYDERLHRIYIGELSASEAERRTRDRVSFKLYHQLPSTPITSYDQLNASYKLFVVYRSSKGKYFHYPIVSHLSRSAMGTQRIQLTVECGEAAPFFNSMEALIKHYETYAIFTEDEKGFGLPDIFPWKTAENEYCSETVLLRTRADLNKSN